MLAFFAELADLTANWAFCGTASSADGFLLDDSIRFTEQSLTQPRKKRASATVSLPPYFIW
ncbi:MAG: hypothetical protein C5B58_07875 [Acidobacteria bacterium]|nr:MAG: hypothetical protein C5B58_07875 [Acidobacteriota bacterium]